MKATLDHVAINARDPKGMLAFYCQVLGLKAERLEAFDAGEVSFASVRITEDTIIDFFPEELWPSGYTPDEGRHRFGYCARARQNHLCLAVSSKDFHELHERLQDMGIPILEGPTPRWGAHGTGISIYFSDPEDNLIEVRHYPEQG